MRATLYSLAARVLPWLSLLTLCVALFAGDARAETSASAMPSGADRCYGKNCRVRSLTATAASGSNAVSLTRGAFINFGTKTLFENVTNELETSTTIRAQSFTSTVASGFNGVSFLTNGARFDLGTGANDYLSSDGSNVSTPGTFTALSLKASDPNSPLYVNGLPILSVPVGSGNQLWWQSPISAAGATTSVPAIKLSPTNTLDANDLLLGVHPTSAAAAVFSVDLEGDVKAAASICANGGTSCLGSLDGFTVSGFAPVGLADATTFGASTRANAGTVKKLDFVIATVGVGASTFKIEVWDQTTGVQKCISGTVACTAAAGTITSLDCGGTYAANDVLVLRRNSSSGCSTQPQLNATARLQE